MRRKLLALAVCALIGAAIAPSAAATNYDIIVINDTTNPWEIIVFRPPVPRSSFDSFGALSCGLWRLPGPTVVCAPNGLDAMSPSDLSAERHGRGR